MQWVQFTAGDKLPDNVFKENSGFGPVIYLARFLFSNVGLGGSGRYHVYGYYMVVTEDGEDESMGRYMLREAPSYVRNMELLVLIP